MSDADREAEAAISALIRSERPHDAICGEEGVSEPGTSGRRWVVDPLDGTVNFLFGYPAWCVSVALEDGDGPRIGVVEDPARAETFRALRGGGCELNGRQVSVRQPVPLERALIATGFGYSPERRAEQARLLADVLPRVRDLRRAGAAALDLAWVAAGRLDGYYDTTRPAAHGPWDYLGGLLVCREAGAQVVDPTGAELVVVDHDARRSPLAAATPQLLGQLIGFIG